MGLAGGSVSKTEDGVDIRPAGLGGLRGLDRLAALDSAPAPAGDVLVAEVRGELWAAVEVDSGAAIADPFRPSADLVELLRLHAQGSKRSSRSLGRLLPRLA